MKRIITELKDIPRNSLWQLIATINTDLDICDRDWDMGVAFWTEKDPLHDKEADGYDKLMFIIAANTIYDEYRKDWYTPVNLGTFMWENRDIFDPFFNKNNRAGYRPKDYDELDPEADTGFFEAYMQPLESLIVGNYSDRAYEELADKFIKKAAYQFEHDESIVRVGDSILMYNMSGEPTYNGNIGTVTMIDDAGQIHGTWGGCALIPGVDEYEKIA